MPISAKTLGTWREAKAIWAKRLGTWRSITNAWVKTSGVWRHAFQALSIDLTDHTFSHVVGSGTATSGVRFSSSGDLDEREGGSYTSVSGEWMDPAGGAPGSGYDVRGVLVSGSTPTGPTLGSGNWYNLGSSREWSIDSTVAQETSVIDFDIRDSGTLSVLASGRITLQAEVVV